MFCSECGKQSTSGRFCWNCGAPLHGADPAPAALSPEQAQPVAPPPLPPPAASPELCADWKNAIEYEVILKAQPVRDLLARQIPPGAGMSAEQFVESAAKFVPNALPASAYNALHGLYVQFGFKTGKEQSQLFAEPPGCVIGAAACALAKMGYKQLEVHQASDGCVLIHEIPSDMLSYAGQLAVMIERVPAGGASVHATASIQGQLFDYGKSKRAIGGLLSGVGEFSRQLTAP